MRKTTLTLILTVMFMIIIIPKALAAESYTVQPNDSLYLIGLKYGVSPQDLRNANGLSSDMIYAGQKLILPPTAYTGNGQQYIVQPGDTLFLIGRKYGVTAQDIAKASYLTGTMIYPGQKLIIPNATGSTPMLGSRSSNGSSRLPFSNSDLDLLAHLIYGEARGEPYNGQVAVAAVALNRLMTPGFPKTLREVIFDPWAFTSVYDGQFVLTPDAISRRAALDALNGLDPTGGALYFWNPEKATSKWIWTRQVTSTIGNHLFGI
ncbi:MAG: cell wall hydrolase [Bacillota bacterium]